MVEKAERDRREYVINISPAGLELLSQIDGVLKEVEDQLFTLSVSESFHLNALLDKLRGS